MKPPEAIPPLTAEGLDSLIGRRVKVNRISNPGKVWWVKIAEIRYVSPLEAIVRVEGHGSFGKPRDVALSSIIWPGKKVDDPLVIATMKARYDAGIK